MLILLIMILLIFMIVNLLMIISNIISKKTFKDWKKNSPFECGFDPKNAERLPFSFQFFLIAIMFLIFDVEITLLLPLISMTEISNFMIFNYMYMFDLNQLLYVSFRPKSMILNNPYFNWNQMEVNHC